ncbi:ATP-binding protein [bacterium]|nr:ATP-binding protein [bacterium]
MKILLMKTQLDDLAIFLEEKGKELGIPEDEMEQVVIDTAASIRLTFPSHTSQLELIRRITKKIATYSESFNEENLEDIGLAIDEACTNVIAHSYRKPGEGKIAVDIDLEPNKITIRLTDRGEEGQTFNPNNLSPVDKEEYLQRLSKGGLGVYLIKKIMDEVEYTVVPGISNTLTMVKFASPAKK